MGYDIKRVGIIQFDGKGASCFELTPNRQYLVYFEDGNWVVSECVGRKMTRDLDTVKTLKEECKSGTGNFAMWDDEHGLFVVKKNHFSDYMNAPMENYEDDLK